MGLPARRPRHRQGPGRRHARVPQELPHDDLRLLRDADGRPRSAGLQGAHEADRGQRSRARHRCHGQHARLKDLVVDMGPFWSKIRAHEALARDGLRGDPGEGVRRLAGADEPHPQGGALHHVRLLRLRVQLDGVRSRVLRPGRAREGFPLRGRPARPCHGRAARGLQRRARDLGLHALLLLQRALPQGRRPSGRDREARRRVDPRRNRPGHGRPARPVVRPLGKDHRLAARDGARAQDAGADPRREGDEVRDQPRPPRQGAATGAAPRGAERDRGPGALRPREGAGPRRRSGHRPG